MSDIQVEKEKFAIDEAFVAADYFSESYGIVVDSRIEVQRIVLRTYGAERYYLRDLPLHHSQRELNATGDYCDFELTLRPTSDYRGSFCAAEAHAHIWHTMIPGLDDAVITKLAEKYDFSGGQIENVARRYAIDSILHAMTDNVLDTLIGHCEGERLVDKNQRKIGF